MRQGAAALRPDPLLAEHVLAHRGRIERYLRAHVGADQVEDLLQELWLKARRAPAPANITFGYLMRMAHNLVIDDARSTGQRKSRDHAWYVDGPAGGHIDATPDAERMLIARDSLRQVESALRALGGRTEHILRRYRVDGISQARIASELGMSLSSVEKHLQRAYRAIAAAQLHADTAREGE